MQYRVQRGLCGYVGVRRQRGGDVYGCRCKGAPRRRQTVKRYSEALAICLLDWALRLFSPEPVKRRIPKPVSTARRRQFSATGDDATSCWLRDTVIKTAMALELRISACTLRQLNVCAGNRLSPDAPPPCSVAFKAYPCPFGQRVGRGTGSFPPQRSRRSLWAFRPKWAGRWACAHARNRLR